MKSFEKYIIFSEEVKNAISEKKPVVTLESTLISHGLPFPENLKTAIETENIVRKNNAVPATIAILKGVIKIGLSKNEIEFLAGSAPVFKCSSGDIPVVISKRLNSATTVSATIACAEMAGLKILATGGIGGVHRNAQMTFDISADLTEISRNSIAVISAGMKSVLDIGLTLEYLETIGVPVIGYCTDEFPAFFTRDSGFKVYYRADSPGEIADIIRAKRSLNLKGGILIANPIPEEYAFDRKIIEDAINNAIKTAEGKNIKGKEITPFLLSEIVNLTKGKSLISNIQLIYNNAKLASEVAVKLELD